MSDKPSYLGLINAIAVGQSRAHAYLTAWAQVTPDADVASRTPSVGSAQLSVILGESKTMMSPTLGDPKWVPILLTRTR